MADPYKKLTAALESRLRGIAARSLAGLPSELGTITAEGLKLDSFPHAIPDYLVAEGEATVRLPAFSLVGTVTSPVDAAGNAAGGATTSARSRFDFAATEIEEVVIDWKAGLKPGDRVLAVPVNGGKDAVVLCKVVGSGG